MRHKSMKLLAFLCCMTLLCTAFSVVAAAEKKGLPTISSENGTPPTIVGHEWAKLGAVTATHEQAKYFIIDTTTKTESGKQYAEQLYISLPAEGGFRLQSKHEYQKELEKSNVGLFEPSSLKTIDYKTDSAGAKILTGADGTVVKFTKSSNGDFKLQICNTKNKNIVSLTNEQISYAYKEGEVVRLMVELPLTRDGKEVIYQGGERFNDTNQVGWYTSLTNVDIGSRDEYAYVNVPIFHSNRGYSIWFNMTYPGEADVGANNPYKYSIIFDGDKLDFYLWAGTPVENIAKYTSITGRSGVNEEWVYGFWAGACATAWKDDGDPNDGDKEDGDQYQNMVTLLEGYMEHYGFYPEVLNGEGANANSALSLQYAKERDIRSLYWFQPMGDTVAYPNDLLGILPTPQYDASGNEVDSGYPFLFVSSLYNQGIFKTLDPRWYDASNPSFNQVVVNRMSQLWSWGSAGAMLDYGEHMSFHGTAYNGLSAMEMHNLNAYYVAKAQYEEWTKQYGNDYVLYMRAGTAGSQKYVTNFLGDQPGSWKGFSKQIYSMISMGASGFNLYGGDIFSNGADMWGGGLSYDMKNRWPVLGLFSPYMRQHGNHLTMPWNEGESLSQNFGTYYYFRKNIVPTIMSASIDANLTGNPMVKGMMVAYPYQLSLSKVNNQYLFCDDFLVCAVERDNVHSLQVSLPGGSTWYSLFTYEAFEGGQSIEAEAPTAFMPVFVKAGAVKAIDLPYSQVLGAEMHDEDDIGNSELVNNYEEAEMPHASLLITPPDEERTSTIYVKDGASTDFQTYEHHTEVYTSKPTGDSTFTVTNEQGSPRETVLALGVTAAKVTYDGNTLARLDHIPDYYNYEYGYYVEPSGLTTIYLPMDWKELTIVKGTAKYEPYDLLVATTQQERMLDGNANSAYQLPLGLDTPLEFTLNYDQPQEIGRIVVKWTTGFMSDYNIEYSVDGENWELLIADENAAETVDHGEHWWSMETAVPDAEYTVSKGAGSFDIINVDNVTAQYIRLITKNFGDAENAQPAIYTFEVYPEAPVEMMDEETPNPPENAQPDDRPSDGTTDTTAPSDDEYDEWFDNGFEDDWMQITDDNIDLDDGAADGTQNGGTAADGPSKQKVIVYYPGLPLWLVIVLIGGGVSLIASVVVLIVMKRKQKRQLATAAAANEDDPDPLDFPGTPTE